MASQYRDDIEFPNFRAAPSDSNWMLERTFLIITGLKTFNYKIDPVKL